MTSPCSHGRRPVVGIIGNSYMIGDRYPVHSGGTMNSAAVADVAGCLPLIIPTDPRYVCVTELLDLCDGFLLTGGRPNVHPSEYGEEDVLAAVVAKPDVQLSDEELIGFLSRRMPHFMVPRYIRHMQALPKTPTAKIEKHVLRSDGVTAETC